MVATAERMAVAGSEEQEASHQAVVVAPAAAEAAALQVEATPQEGAAPQVVAQAADRHRQLARWSTRS